MLLNHVRNDRRCIQSLAAAELAKVVALVESYEGLDCRVRGETTARGFVLIYAISACKLGQTSRALVDRTFDQTVADGPQASARLKHVSLVFFPSLH